MFFLIFLAAALLAWMGMRPALARAQSGAGPRRAGMVLVGASLSAGFAGLVYLALQSGFNPDAFATPEAVMARPLFPDALRVGALLFLLTLAVYVLSGLRGLAGLPTYIADGVVLGAAWLGVRALERPLLQLATSTAPDSPTLALGVWGVPLAVIWVWGVARAGASLNRVPGAPSGYLGVLAGLIFLLLSGAMSANDLFAPCASAAIAGAALAVFARALNAPERELGWSATLAMGFALGLASVLGLGQSPLWAWLAFGVFALGLPWLNLTLSRVRAKMRGARVEWKHGRLHQVLLARGVAPRKVALLFFSLALWSCSFAFWGFSWLSHPAPSVLAVVGRALFAVLWLGLGAIGFFSIGRISMRRTPNEKVPDRIEAFGVEISPVSMGEALDQIEAFIACGTPHHVLTSDANAILTSESDPEYAAIMRRAALITPDGFGVIWGARLLNLPVYERVTGVDMVTGVCERAARKGYRLYILGAEEGVATTAAANLTQKYPGLQVVGTHHGFWRRDGREAGLSVEQSDVLMAQQIAEHRPDVLFVAMGIPHQEKFIAAQLDRLQVPVALGVGGSFDVYSGKFNRAPLTVQRLGLEWLYRVWIDPSRWKRMGYVPRFMLVALKTWLFGPKRPTSGAL